MAVTAGTLAVLLRIGAAFTGHLRGSSPNSSMMAALMV